MNTRYGLSVSASFHKVFKYLYAYYCGCCKMEVGKEV